MEQPGRAGEDERVREKGAFPCPATGLSHTYTTSARGAYVTVQQDLVTTTTSMVA